MCIFALVSTGGVKRNVWLHAMWKFSEYYSTYRREIWWL